MITKPDDNVHPVTIPWADGLGNDTYPGLTKREYFAAMAMQGQAAYGAFRPEEAVLFADLLISALNYPKPPTEPSNPK